MAWWATSEPAPNAMPVAKVLPSPESMPGCLIGCTNWGGGLVAAKLLLVAYLGLLPLEPKLPLPLLGITIRN
jgi:hypothetical protein